MDGMSTGFRNQGDVPNPAADWPMSCRFHRPASGAGYFSRAWAWRWSPAVTAIALVPFNLEFGSDLWTDPQDDRQVLGQWRAMAAFAYTSGGWIGQVFALVSGVLVARWSAQEARRVGWAVAAGFGLGLTDLVAAWSRAAPELHRSRSHDPVLVHQGCVVAAMVVTLALFAITSVLGFRIGRAQGVARCGVS
jgi:hypothetical protein